MAITGNTLGNKISHFFSLFLNISPKEHSEIQVLLSSFLHWTFYKCKVTCFSKNLDLPSYCVMHVMGKKLLVQISDFSQDRIVSELYKDGWLS